jgi:predicted MPP superfamily phosphohydrolase
VAKELGHAPVGRWSSRLMAHFPHNQICHLAVPVKTLRLDRLPPALDGLSIVQLSDLHFTGQLTLDYYQFVVDRANELAGDMIVITGDIIDRAACLDWIPAALGRLRARHGVYFVLGNHDKRLRDINGLRKTLVRAGLTDVGGRMITLDIDGCELHLAGNELPWFPLRAAPEAFLPQVCQVDQFRLLLAHSPDQIFWAQERGFDLMLAGHCHGGQVRLPMIGPIVSPSRYGARYASGLFHEPPTLMHVSRGLAGTHPIRINCLPELVKLVLTVK